MSDARLRELERRWRDSESVEDEAAYLRERVRTGELASDRLALAAHCGHAASAIVIGQVASSADPGLEVWVQGLTTWGRMPLVRVAVLAARIVLRDGGGSDLPHERALAAVEEWIACPCQAHKEEAVLAGADAINHAPQADAGWACADAAASLGAAPELVVKAVRRAERSSPAAAAEVRAGLLAWAFAGGSPG